MSGGSSDCECGAVSMVLRKKMDVVFITTGQAFVRNKFGVKGWTVEEFWFAWKMDDDVADLVIDELRNFFISITTPFLDGLSEEGWYSVRLVSYDFSNMIIGYLCIPDVGILDGNFVLKNYRVVEETPVSTK